MTPPKNAAQSAVTTPNASPAFGTKCRAELTDGPRVAANDFKGLGAPETVTVGTDGLGLGFWADEELVIVNREETE